MSQMHEFIMYQAKKLDDYAAVPVVPVPVTVPQTMEGQLAHLEGELNRIRKEIASLCQ